MIYPKATKQVIIINRSCKMRRGKEIAQGAHASLAFLTKRIVLPWYTIMWRKITGGWLSSAERHWLRHSYTKITLQVDTEEELLTVYRKAKEFKLEATLIKDNGITEFNGTITPTAVAIGPDWSSKIDKVTSNLKLY